MENREIKENLEATEVDAQELEEMDAPIDDGTVSAVVSATAVSVGVTIT